MSPSVWSTSLGSWTGSLLRGSSVSCCSLEVHLRTVLMQADHMPRSNKIIAEKEKELGDKQKQMIKSAAEASNRL